MVESMSFESFREASVKILEGFQYENGLFAAAPKNVSTGYHAAWIRDTLYQAMGLEAANLKRAVKAYQALLDVLRKHEYKIDWAIKEKPDAKFKYIHPRYHPQTLEEYPEEWGYKQHDAIGLLLFKICQLERKGIKVIRDAHDRLILQKLVHYLENVQYWQDPDNGIWENDEELHASSLGACVAGLEQAKVIVLVPQELIDKGRAALNDLLPRESASRSVDLAQLSLIYPLNVVSASQAAAILKNVEEQLVRNRGVIRYHGDCYYNAKGEAEWTFGFPWLALIYKQQKMPHKYAFYMRKTIEAMNEKAELPELYYANSSSHNPNCPLGWAQAMYLLAVGE